MGEKEVVNGGADEKEKKKEADAGGAKKDEGPSPVVLKLDVHCEGCAHKIKRAVKGFDGVEGVKVDVAGNKVTAAGAKVDAVALRSYLETKTRKKVELISPKDPPAAAKKDADGGGKKDSGEGKKDKKDSDGDKKPKAAALATTVVLKLRLHCEGCIQRIRKTISKIKGVEQVSVDAPKDLVTVKGTMDVKSLPSLLKDKLKRSVEIVPPKKDNADGGGGGGGGGEKKDKAGDGGGGEKKDKGGEGEKKDKGGDGQKKDKGGDGGKEKEKGGGGGGGEKKENKEDGGKAAPMEVNKMEYYGGGYAPYGYHVGMVHAPQLFSDENPNACSVM